MKNKLNVAIMLIILLIRVCKLLTVLLVLTYRETVVGQRTGTKMRRRFSMMKLCVGTRL